QGAKLLNRYNCTGCHVLEMPRYTIAAGSELRKVFTNFDVNVTAAYNSRATDYLKTFYPDLTYDPNGKPELPPDDPDKPVVVNRSITFEGMPVGTFENELTVQLWRPVTIQGFTFIVGDNLAVVQTRRGMP